MVAHEYAHGWAALRQGDPTAYQLGRLTWNPLKHIDPFMTVILPILTFITVRLRRQGDVASQRFELIGSIPIPRSRE